MWNDQRYSCISCIINRIFQIILYNISIFRHISMAASALNIINIPPKISSHCHIYRKVPPTECINRFSGKNGSYPASRGDYGSAPAGLTAAHQFPRLLRNRRPNRPPLQHPLPEHWFQYCHFSSAVQNLRQWTAGTESRILPEANRTKLRQYRTKTVETFTKKW